MVFDSSSPGMVSPSSLSQGLLHICSHLRCLRQLGLCDLLTLQLVLVQVASLLTIYGYHCQKTAAHSFRPSNLGQEVDRELSPRLM